ncbi:MAG: efflux RND transporter periplasmic adaptor subunit, partial [Chthoniobacteraceae bacterium]
MITRKLIHCLIATAAILGFAGVAGCQKRGAAADPNVDYYTCTMHPSVHSKIPGKCPICSMDLVPVMKKGASNPTSLQAGGRKIKHYKSTMMPGEISPKPAKDSMGMDMVPVYADQPAGGGNQLSEFSVPVERQQQIGVTFATAERKPLHHVIRTVGMVVADRKRHWEFVARVEGYVQKLYVTSPGEPIEEGQPLLTIYSPELATA